MNGVTAKGQMKFPPTDQMARQKKNYLPHWHEQRPNKNVMGNFVDNLIASWSTESWNV